MKFRKDLKKILVIDAGSYTSRFGFAGESQPILVEPSIIGYPRVLEHPEEIEVLKDYYIGEEVEKFRKKLKIYWIFEPGFINWMALVYFLKKICNERLRLDFKDTDSSILITRDPLLPDEDLEKFTEIMFEDLGISNLCIYLAQTLSLFQIGKNSGLIIDIGFDKTKFVPFFQSKYIRQGVVSMPVAGYDITQYLARLMRQLGIAVTYSTDQKFLRDIQEKLCYVSLDPENDIKARRNELPTKQYSLRGKEITLREELFLAPECLFMPLALGKESRNIIENIIYSIALSNGLSYDDTVNISEEFFSNKDVLEKDLTKELFSNIILTGGGSLISGLKERIIKEFEKIIPKGFEFNIYNPELRYSSWLGGSQLASKSNSENIWLKKEDYKKEGPSIIHKYVQNDLI